MNRRLIAAIFMTAFLQEVAIVVLRVTTSYRALELGVSPLVFGAINAAYAILPIFLAVSVGRIVDRGQEIRVARISGIVMLLASFGFLLWPGVPGLMLFTAILGIAFLSLTVCTQVICARVGATPLDFQRTIGSYLVATASGQGIGSLIVALIGGDSALPPTQPLYAAVVAASALTLVATFFLRTRAHEANVEADGTRVPMAEIFRIPRFRLLLSVSVICVACVDLILIYLPVYGAERGYTVEFVGILLTIRSVMTLAARVLFARLGLLFGAQLLTTWSALVSAACCLAFLAPLPAWSLYGLIALIGFALSVCQTVTMTTFLALASDNIRGTVTSVRMIGNRVGQFAFPVLASMVATVSGTAMIFAMMGAALALSAGAAQWKRPREVPPPRS